MPQEENKKAPKKPTFWHSAIRQRSGIFKTCWPELKLVTGSPLHCQNQGAVEWLNGVVQDKSAIWILMLAFTKQLDKGHISPTGLESYVPAKSLVDAAKTEEEIEEEANEE
ncbi:hypothetical protein T07_12778 [Trichinella nelsoni]|uniref:KRAB-A domain-containing protein 2 n=1 Tax=Trichinella nelsoni TaxID=6336 RepID=A0A0V0RKL3_9BILA|nr:hypothetical protein T07_12778 [Trichinella nelsoni]